MPSRLLPSRVGRKKSMPQKASPSIAAVTNPYALTFFGIRKQASPDGVI
jgi:hypothetical protein